MCSVCRRFVVAGIVVAALVMPVAAQTPVGTVFTYQGQLRSGGAPANGLHDCEFRLFDAATLGNQVGPTVCLDGVDVVDGLFTVQLDFGGQFMTDGRWLELAVRADAVPGNCESGQFTILSPRQPLTAAPFALALPYFRTESTGGSPNVIGGSSANSVTAGASGGTISGGGQSFAGGPHVVTDRYCVIAGGLGNQTGNADGNVDNARYAVVGGGVHNRALLAGSTVGGGDGNIAGGEYATIGGGQQNVVADTGCMIGGGSSNEITDTGFGSVIGGGFQNWISSELSMIGGGVFNRVATSAPDGGGSVIGGGYLNQVVNNAVTIAGGSNNIAAGEGSAIPGGIYNQAGGDYSFAAGRRAKARDAAQSGDPDGDEGTFVWADSTDADFASTGPNQFLVRASGGVAINVNDPLGFTLAVNGEAAKPGGGSWAAYSDARLKTDVRPIANSLDRVLALRGIEFEYSSAAVGDGRGRPGKQIGFVAQDVEQVLPDWVGQDTAGFKHVTERGATALLVEALRELRAEKDRQLAERDAQIAEMLRRLEHLEVQANR